MTVFKNWSLLRNKKQNFADNHLDNILRLSDILANFLFTTSETKREYNNKHRFIKDRFMSCQPT